VFVQRNRERTISANVTDAFVTGAGSIGKIGPGVVLVSSFMEFEESHDSDRECKIVVRQIWSLPQLMDSLLVMRKVLKKMRSMRGSRSWYRLRDVLSEQGRCAVMAVAAQRVGPTTGSSRHTIPRGYRVEQSIICGIGNALQL
jgi:hypothetical protein